jgi:hypothetical protein
LVGEGRPCLENARLHGGLIHKAGVEQHILGVLGGGDGVGPQLIEVEIADGGGLRARVGLFAESEGGVLIVEVDGEDVNGLALGNGAVGEEQQLIANDFGVGGPGEGIG